MLPLPVAGEGSTREGADRLVSHRRERHILSNLLKNIRHPAFEALLPAVVTEM
jgi:hypothetical protein